MYSDNANLPGIDLRDVPLLASPFVFLRHGETESNRLGIIAGSNDVPLNATGREQARQAARRLAGSGIDAIWSSPLERARITAACVAEALDLHVYIVPQLAERNWGALEGTPRELRVPAVSPPGGENLDAFRARTAAALRAIGASRLPLVVAHSGTFRVLREWLRIPPRSVPLENCAPLRIASHPQGWQITPL
ncbi:MAG: histidine phosphatase family protein [Burkholderiales bacterium]|nr:histidine phosphatase family protein [Burkholderiales bacterium]